MDGGGGGGDAGRDQACFNTLALSPSLKMHVIFFMVLFMELNIQIDSLFPSLELGGMSTATATATTPPPPPPPHYPQGEKLPLNPEKSLSSLQTSPSPLQCQGWSLPQLPTSSLSCL